MRIKHLLLITLFITTSSVYSQVTSVADGVWTNSTSWSDGLSPSGAKDYVIDGETLSTQNGTATFAGRSLTISSGALQLKNEHSGTGTTAYYDIQNLTMSGGSLLGDASVGTAYWRVDRSIHFTNSSIVKIFQGWYDHDFHFDGGVTGTGTINLQCNLSQSGNSSEFFVHGVSNSFSGLWTVTSFDNAGTQNKVHVMDQGAMGTGSITLSNKGALYNDVTNGLDSVSLITLDDDEAVLNLTYPWYNEVATLDINHNSATLNLGDGDTVIKKMIINGNEIPNTIYTASDLTALGYGGVYTGSGTLRLKVKGTVIYVR